MKNKFLTISLLCANILAASNINNSNWKEKEDIASDINAPAEVLLDIKNNTTNPFVLNALNTNPKYIKLKENENKIKLLESKKLFKSNLDKITNNFDLVNENLKKILYIYKINNEKEELIRNELVEKFGKMKTDFKKRYKRELDKLNVEFKANLMQINSNINKLNLELKRKKEKFSKQLLNYVKLEQKKMLFKTENINKETKMMKEEISSIINYLDNIQHSIYDIIQNVKFKELKNTINPELLTIQALYENNIKQINQNINKIFSKKTKFLYLLEMKTILKAEKERKIKIIKMNKILTKEKIKKEAKLKKELIDIETKKKLRETEAKYQKESNVLEININELNLQINKILYVFNKISEEDKTVAHQLNQFKKLIETLKLSKELIIEKDYQIDKEHRTFKTSVERKIKIASNFNTPVNILVEYSRNLDWRVREAVAKNEHTPIEILKDLSVDNNLFVSTTAQKTLDYINRKKQAESFLTK